MQLQGASLEGADLQGASLFQAYLQDVSFKGVLYAWRANTRKAVWKDTRVELQKVELEKVLERNWSAARGEDEMVKIWAARERESPAPEAYAKSLAGQWRNTGCDAPGAPYVLHALIVKLSGPVSPFRDQSDTAKALAAAFLDEAHCAGAQGLSEEDKAILKKIAAPAAPQVPKP